jgi:hypothetical protein
VGRTTSSSNASSFPSSSNVSDEPPFARMTISLDGSGEGGLVDMEWREDDSSLGLADETGGS